MFMPNFGSERLKSRKERDGCTLTAGLLGVLGVTASGGAVSSCASLAVSSPASGGIADNGISGVASGMAFSLQQKMVNDIITIIGNTLNDNFILLILFRLILRFRLNLRLWFGSSGNGKINAHIFGI
jgi:hypothetical protein